jgi:hypothetical protein
MSPTRDSGPDPAVGSDAAADYPAPCPDPAVLGDAVDRGRRTSGLALRDVGSGRTYSYRDFITTSYKAGNVLRHLGVRPGDEVGVAADRTPETVLTFYGAAQLGAVTRFGRPTRDEPPRVVVAPTAREAEFDLPPGHHLVTYGDRPEGSDVTHWETEVWSENPAIHPVAVDSTEPLLAAGDRTYTHAELLSAAAAVVSTAPLDPGCTVTVHRPLTDPTAVAAGLVAPILAGATVVLPAADDPAGAPIDVDGTTYDRDPLGIDGA